MRKNKIIAGNWKMHKTVGEALTLVKSLHYGLSVQNDVDIIVAPSFTALHPVANFLENSFIASAAQDIFWEDKGAFTGEISGAMISDLGVEYVIIGHSERRQYFGETDDTVNLKIKAAQKHSLAPIVCVGETLSQREAGLVYEILSQQLLGGLKDLSVNNLENVIIAYEPVWAIGTGVTASSDQANDAHRMIRDILAKQWTAEAGDNMKILYGGSVKPDNAKELLNLEHVDGALVGGASLNPEDFIKIIRSIHG
jgi:triosephosphate isomerase